MICSNCGKSVKDSAGLCPHCGAALQTASADPAAQEKKKTLKTASKSKKKNLISIIAVVLAATLIVTGIFAVPSFLRGGYAKNNIFVAPMKDAKADTASQEVATVFAAAHNTVFNSKGFSAKVVLYGKTEIFDGRVVFGSDLASSKALIKLENGYECVALRDGRLIVTEDEDWAMRINVRNLLDDYKALLDVIPWDNMPHGSKEDAYREADAVKTATDALIENKLNIASLDTILNGLYHIFGDTVGRFLDCTDLTLSELLELIAEYVAQMPDDMVKTEVKKQDGAVKYGYRFNTRELYTDLINFALESEKADGMISSAAETMMKAVRSEIKLDHRLDADVQGEIVIENKYITEFTLGRIENGEYEEVLKITVKDVNKTEIDDSKLETVFNSVDEDKMIIIDNVEDLETYIYGERYDFPNDGLDDVYEFGEDYGVDDDFKD